VFISTTVMSGSFDYSHGCFFRLQSWVVLSTTVMGGSFDYSHGWFFRLQLWVVLSLADFYISNYFVLQMFLIDYQTGDIIMQYIFGNI